MISLKQTGDFSNLSSFLKRCQHPVLQPILDYYGRQGVAALKSATPVDTGLTAGSWRYETEISGGKYSITFHNDNVQKGVPIAIILEYGHGTRNGGYVKGKHYIDPAIQPVFEQLAKKAWGEVIK